MTKTVKYLKKKILKISNKYNFSIILLSFLLLSCKKETSTPLDLGVYTDYYPLNIGNYHTYLVDSIFYDDFNAKSDTFQYQLKEMITDTFFDEEEQLNYRLERFYKYKTKNESFDTIPWQLKNVWFITKTGNTIQRVEENYRYVTLTNPIKDGITWDGNAFNTKDKTNYSYEDFGETLAEKPNSVAVIEQDIENLFEKKYYEHYFAKGIGITRYYYIDVQSQDISDPSIPITERIEKGVQYTQTLIDYYIE